MSNSKTICGIRFSNSGAFLAVPKTDSISVLQRDSWIEAKSLKCEKLEEKEILTCVAWRKDESMIVAGTSKVRFAFRQPFSLIFSILLL